MYLIKWKKNRNDRGRRIEIFLEKAIRLVEQKKKEGYKVILLDLKKQRRGENEN